VVDPLVGSEVERELDALVPRWIAEDWPLTTPRYVGRELSWTDWIALADVQRDEPGHPGGS
jgi:hypothetical protein